MPAEFDFRTASDAGKVLAGAFAPGVAAVIADFTNTGFCDTAGIHEVVKARRLALACEVELRLVIPPGLRLLFRMTGLDKVLPVYPDLTQALAADPAPA